ncbi:MAG TPA: hypothetical protein VF014_03375 [Casimicrobiaceae bacterium]|nr:hypothetical protein [Casimicrobiaceae bacterium]
MPLAYDVHPEFGYFSPGPRIRRELRVAVVSILVGMVVGAAIVTVHAGRAVEMDAVSSHAQLKSLGPDTSVAGVAEPSSSRDNVKAYPAEAIKPYPMRMVRVRSSKAASPLASIPLGHTAPPEPEIAPAPALPPSPEEAEGSGAPAASPQAQSFAALAGTNKRISTRPRVVEARRQWDDENENEAWQNRRRPDWGERAYAEDRYWRGAYRDWGY